jgi:hypothetical protein
MDLSGTAKAQVLDIEQSQEDAGRQVLESVAGTLAAVKRLVAAYDRVNSERDNFERQLASVLVENETLRRQTKEAKDHSEHFSKALTTLTDQMDVIGARCIEAVKIARTQSYDQAAMVPAHTPPPGGPNSPEQPTMPGTAAGARAQTNDQASPKPQRMDNRLPAEQQPTAPSAPTAAPDAIHEVLRSAQTFAQYFIQ